MCGIAGIISLNGEHDFIVNDIIQISNSIKHRGPDDEGFLISANQQLTCFGGVDTPPEYYTNTLNYAPIKPLHQHKCMFALLHRRLSILDLSIAGHQPLNYQHLWITFNGEIYNYVELRIQLEQQGFKFFTKTDTEVILAAFIYWGESCVEQFNGMWSFVIYNTITNELFASRDRLGVKPFYYYLKNDLFAFASEQKAFLNTSFYKKEVNVDAFLDYFILDKYEQNSEGVYKDIFELFPGHSLTFNLNTRDFKVYKYLNLSVNTDFVNIDSLSTKRYQQEIEENLIKAISLRLRSDVPVGSCLSGGIDSSSIVGLMNELNPSNQVHLFTASMKQKEFDESDFANEVALKTNGKWHQTFPTAEELINDLNDLIYSQDIPIWSTSTYAQFSVMKLAKQNNIKVLLDGQGSDELFGGYPIHLIPYWTDLLKSQSYSQLISSLKSNHGVAYNLPFYLKRWLADFKLYQLSPKLQLQIIKSIHPEVNYLAPDLETKIIERLKLNKETFFEKTPSLNEFLFHESYNNRLKSYLKCEDRCSMWHSVEARTPFADDVNLIKLAFEIPGNFKIQNGQLKFLLREAMRAYLPEKVYNRKDKMGYNTPNKQWILDVLKNRNDLFSSNSNSIFNTKAIADNKQMLFNSENSRLFKLVVSDIWLKQ